MEGGGKSISIRLLGELLDWACVELETFISGVISGSIKLEIKGDCANHMFYGVVFCLLFWGFCEYIVFMHI